MQPSRMQLSNTEALTQIRAFLSEAWVSGTKVYLVSPGNYSKRDYEKMAQDFGSRLIVARSIFSGWLRAISFFVPNSYAGALEMTKNENWAATILNLAGHGYQLIVAGKGSDVESAVIGAIRSRWPSNRLPQMYESLAAQHRVFMVNAEDQNQVEIKVNT